MNEGKLNEVDRKQRYGKSSKKNYQATRKNTNKMVHLDKQRNKLKNNNKKIKVG